MVDDDRRPVDAVGLGVAAGIGERLAAVEAEAVLLAGAELRARRRASRRRRFVSGWRLPSTSTTSTSVGPGRPDVGRSCRVRAATTGRARDDRSSTPSASPPPSRSSHRPSGRATVASASTLAPGPGRATTTTATGAAAEGEHPGGVGTVDVERLVAVDAVGGGGRRGRRGRARRARPSVAVVGPGVDDGRGPGGVEQLAAALGRDAAAVVGVDERQVPALAALVHVGHAGGEQLGEELGQGGRPAGVGDAVGEGGDVAAELRVAHGPLDELADAAPRRRSSTSVHDVCSFASRSDFSIAGHARSTGSGWAPTRVWNTSQPARGSQPSTAADASFHHADHAASTSSGTVVSAARRARTSAARFVSWVDSVVMRRGHGACAAARGGVPGAGVERRRSPGSAPTSQRWGSGSHRYSAVSSSPLAATGPVSCWKRSATSASTSPRSRPSSTSLDEVEQLGVELRAPCARAPSTAVRTKRLVGRRRHRARAGRRRRSGRSCGTRGRGRRPRRAPRRSASRAWSRWRRRPSHTRTMASVSRSTSAVSDVGEHEPPRLVGHLGEGAVLADGAPATPR